MSARTESTHGTGPSGPRIFLLAALGLFFAAPALAQQGDAFDEIRFSRPDYYLGGTMVAGIPIGGRDLDHSYGFDIRMGNRISRWWSLEVYGEWIHEFDDDDDDVKLNVWGFGAATRFYPLAGRIQPFVQTGFGFLQSREYGDGSANQSTGVAPRAGVGVDYYLRSGLALSLDTTVVVPIGQPRDVDFVRIGLGFLWY